MDNNVSLRTVKCQLFFTRHKQIMPLRKRAKSNTLNALETSFHNAYPQITLMPKDKDKDLFIGPKEFVLGYSKAPE